MQNEIQEQPQDGKGLWRLRASYGLGAAWLVLFLAFAFCYGSSIASVLWVIQMLLLLAIVIIHGSVFYGYVGISLYVVVGLIVSFVLEAMSVSMGFPYGSYVHHSPGPRLLGVPMQAMFIYLVYGWFAWAVTRVICLDQPWRKGGRARLVTPLVAGFVLAGFDYPIDPILSTINRLWTFEDPRGQFGVPVTNYLGWILTGWVLFQIVSCFEERFPAAEASRRRSYWLLPCLVWVAQAIQYPILWSNASTATVQYGTRVFVISDVFEAAIAGSLFTVLFVGLLGLVCLGRYSRGVE